MKEIKIGHLAYLLKKAKEKNQPQPIFFLGAGASRSGNIPLAGEIIKKIIADYSDSPFIQDLPTEQRTYAKLMDCLSPDERDELLKKYISEAKINVTHIYLAQLLKEDFVDYVLTVNFDNLMLRALALYNIFPSTYDMAILKDLTTTAFKEKSVVYLHGQSHGLWLLNTPEEMDKVKTIVPRIFDAIKSKRPWIFIGYSGDDPIFEHIRNLGRFSNGLFWVTYQDHSPNERVQKFLMEPNTNASIIKGYDADSFMLKLNTELGLGQPSIVDKPFTALRKMLDEIVDIDDKDHFKGVKERLEISKRQVDEAIQQNELGVANIKESVTANPEIDLLKKEIINLMIEEKYEENIIKDIEDRAMGIEDEDLKSKLSGLYSDWGIELADLANTKTGQEKEDLYLEAFAKYQRAIEIWPDKHIAFYNWGTNLGDFAKTKSGQEAENLYKSCFEKYQRAAETKPTDDSTFYNWGTDLGYFAGMKEDQEAMDLYKECFAKYQKAVELKPDKFEAFYNWGMDLGNMAKSKSGQEAEDLYQESFVKFQKAIEIKSDYYDSFYNWGTYLGNLAKTKKGKEAEDLYNEAFTKFQKAIEIKPDHIKAYNNWGIYLKRLAKSKGGLIADYLYDLSIEKLRKAFELGGDSYNLARLYAIKNNKKDALFYLNISLKNNEIEVSFVEQDEDWKNFLEDKELKKVLDKYR